MKHGHCTMQRRRKKHAHVRLGTCESRTQDLPIRAGMRRGRDACLDSAEINDDLNAVVYVNPTHMIDGAINVFTDAGLAEKIKAVVLKIAKPCLVGELSDLSRLV